ncbi:endoplasmic reticulum mannosyl-oligosaccharide 1 [Kluyveromyces marxianus]|uniref:alpha-1,2-Mannosidase n=2 Tax=Kluyveromyces marxianus TaxID=4911 RepID=W0TBX8_KLUMD|nr:endoplasmic reticulum mannosyl-oligosaccharide 1 [Kluyveromyces marxianus DMKU3-1042]QGN16262.1 endoplasmic reticulum mannosyl-oligosaccharide 1 [Kluyveromyces marxianus]BAO40533.1 endoplasmic reticulum mannosyl-oligosaccharide 1 [Kluyveromyces marxianus DMKU3-1042]BAP72015.1 endoplasmic reticulum mannosyl-oligosaccharide 1 [Kluyveromyces marxianus]
MKWTVTPIICAVLAITVYQYGARFLQETYKSKDVKFEIESVFLESWTDYRENGWGYDVYGPVSKKGKNMGRSGDPLGWIIVDSIDTMMIMYNKSSDEDHRKQFAAEIQLAEEWVDNTLNYDIDSEVNVFETTIRMLGGLLSAYHCSETYKVGNSTVYLNKAIDLGDRLASSFTQSATGIPYSSINLGSGKAIKNHVDNGASSTAEFTTLQMEMKYLSYITGNSSYWTLSEAVYEPIYKNNNVLGRHYQGLVPIYTNPDTGMFQGSTIRFGSRGDSFYEYLLKQNLLTGESLYRKLYNFSMKGMKRHLLDKSRGNLALTYIGEKEYGLAGPTSSKFDHLVCFMGGLLAMGATDGKPYTEAISSPDWDPTKQSDWDLAQQITKSCYEMYRQIPSGLSPEIVVFNSNYPVYEDNWWVSETKDYFVKPLDRHNIQRPETVESLMFLYHLSGEEKYRHWGYEIFKSFVKHTKVVDEDTETSAYTSLHDVISIPTNKADNMESFWLAETLKYLYLLFDDEVDLTKIVFNTEAHPFPVFDQKRLDELNLTTGWKP